MEGMASSSQKAASMTSPLHYKPHSLKLRNSIYNITYFRFDGFYSGVVQSLLERGVHVVSPPLSPDLTCCACGDTEAVTQEYNMMEGGMCAAYQSLFTSGRVVHAVSVAVPASVSAVQEAPRGKVGTVCKGWMPALTKNYH